MKKIPFGSAFVIACITTVVTSAAMHIIPHKNPFHWYDYTTWFVFAFMGGIFMPTVRVLQKRYDKNNRNK